MSLKIFYFIFMFRLFAFLQFQLLFTKILHISRNDNFHYSCLLYDGIKEISTSFPSLLSFSTFANSSTLPWYLVFTSILHYNNSRRTVQLHRSYVLGMLRQDINEISIYFYRQRCARQLHYIIFTSKCEINHSIRTII